MVAGRSLLFGRGSLLSGRRSLFPGPRSRLCGLAAPTIVGGAGGGGGSSADSEDEPADGEILFAATFEDAPLGPYEPRSADWGGCSLDVRSAEHLSVVETRAGDRVLEAQFPAGVAGAGNTNGGGDFIVDLGASYEELYCSYRVRFCEGFEFHQPGGKLPGLAGTNTDEERTITGGVEPDGENGWSARMMWRDPATADSVERSESAGARATSSEPSGDAGGDAMFYVYHPDRPGEWGDNAYWDDGASGQVRFQRGEWHQVEHRVVLNTVGEHDGIRANGVSAGSSDRRSDGVLEGWFDGEKAFERTDLRFRTVPELGIDEFYFSLFFGGDQNETWAHDRAERVQFDDLVVSTGPV